MLWCCFVSLILLLTFSVGVGDIQRLCVVLQDGLLENQKQDMDTHSQATQCFRLWSSFSDA